MTFSAALRLVEQILFVFVASLWPNAVGGGNAPVLPELRPVNLPPREERHQEDVDDDDDDDDDDDV
jgi:hypothetical protein